MSRTLDAEVALHVFERKTIGRVWGLAWIGTNKEVPFYSTSIEAAWEVALAMMAKGWNFCLQDNPRGVGAYFSNDADYDNDGAREATGPLAICVAALAALKAPQ